MGGAGRPRCRRQRRDQGNGDPNIYLLEDERGEEVGWVHLAYANNEGEGILYVRYGSDDLVEIDKVDRIPIYQVYD